MDVIIKKFFTIIKIIIKDILVHINNFKNLRDM